MGTVYGLQGGCWWRREGEARPPLLKFEQAKAAAMEMGRGWRGSEARGRELRVVGDCEGARGLLI